MIPGRTNRLLIQADAPGIYKGQCAEYCGGPHALMGLVVVAHTPQDFARWQDSRQPRGGEGGEGIRLFLSSGCAACHPIRSDEHTSELQSPLRNSYAVFCLQKKKSK